MVGGGSAGCVVANRLTADPGCRVLLLDAGRPDTHPFTRIPAGQMPAFMRPDMNWLYRAEPDPTIDGRVNIWPAGKVLGGGSAINGMMFVRGHRLDYDRWAAMGATGWDYQSVLPYFRRLETNEGGGNAFRGGDGPLQVSGVRVSHPLTDAFLQSALAAGLPFNPDLNGEVAEGFGPCQASQRRGLRHSTAQAYIRPVASRPNLRVLHHAAASRIILNGDRAEGVEGICAGSPFSFRARRGVIVCAGAIATPRLLMLSGIGPREELARHGVETRHHLPGVGRNLQEHAMSHVSLMLHGVDTITSALSPLTAIGYGLDYLLRRRGPLASCIGHVHGLVRTDPALPQPDAQIIFAPIDFELTERGAVPVRVPSVGFGVGLCHTHSFGEIRLRSADPGAAPVIDHRLLADERDVGTLIAALRLARRIVQTEPFAAFVSHETAPGPDTQDDARMERFVRQSAGLMYHPCGTCRMGQGDDAVVDPALRVRGLGQLWVADASIMPSITAGNINATCIMIGEKAADLVSGASL